MLAWAVREGATNVIRHSGARHCTVKVSAPLGGAEVEVLDDGGGERTAALPSTVAAGMAGRPARARRQPSRADRGGCSARRRLSAVGAVPARRRSPRSARLMIRILLAEDQGMVRGALASLLALEPDFEVVAQVARGDEVVAGAREAQPDVALLDIEMPGATGLEAAEQLRELPECRVLILTTFGRPGYLRRAMESGASGFLFKDAPASELASAVRRAVAGERVVDPAWPRRRCPRARAP